MNPTQRSITADAVVDRVVRQIGRKIVLATPLGAGKPNHLINAFYRRALADPAIDLTICTALTLQRPKGKSDLEQRFVDLFEDRLFGDFPDLEYEIHRVNGTLPDNVHVVEFYFAPGKYLSNRDAQQHYVSSNYTHVVRDVMDRGVNVLAQMVAKEKLDGQTQYSLSSNPDVSLDLATSMAAAGKQLFKVAQVNQNMPFMYGDAVVPADFFDLVLDDPSCYFTLFGPPKVAISPADYLIGLYCSTLIKDDGEIQIGIGSLGDATIYHLLLRQQQPEVYHRLLADFRVKERFGFIIDHYGDTGSFDTGLFGASEMIVDGFRQLYQSGIVKKKVYDHIGLQRLINDGLIREAFDDDILDVLRRHRIIHERITQEDFDFLQYWGILRTDLQWEHGSIITADKEEIPVHLSDPACREFLKTHCLGAQLRNGQIMHGGFFLGPQSFYTWLRELPADERKLINMKSVHKINQLYGHEILDRLHRKNARFINTCMMQTLSGAAVSDGYQDGRVVSGVGGQYNFVAMAQELPDGHSILNLRSTRKTGGKLSSNIVPYYGHITIPRHLRDIVVTEYGIAFLRGKTDQEIIQELLKITDSRFQGELLHWAKKTGKLNEAYEIPPAFRQNLPEHYEPLLAGYQEEGLFPAFPFGTELTSEELQIGRALKALKADMDARAPLLKTILLGLMTGTKPEHQRLLARLKLDQPQTVKEWLYKKLVNRKLRELEST